MHFWSLNCRLFAWLGGELFCAHWWLPLAASWQQLASPLQGLAGCGDKGDQGRGGGNTWGRWQLATSLQDKLEKSQKYHALHGLFSLVTCLNTKWLLKEARVANQIGEQKGRQLLGRSKNFSRAKEHISC